MMANNNNHATIISTCGSIYQLIPYQQLSKLNINIFILFCMCRQHTHIDYLFRDISNKLARTPCVCVCICIRSRRICVSNLPKSQPMWPYIPDDDECISLLWSSSCHKRFHFCCCRFFSRLFVRCVQKLYNGMRFACACFVFIFCHHLSTFVCSTYLWAVHQTHMPTHTHTRPNVFLCRKFSWTERRNKSECEQLQRSFFYSLSL